MIGWNDDIEIDISAADCFYKATDLEQCQRWIPQIQQIERLDSGALTQGSRWRETRKEGKRLHTMELELFESHSPAEGEPPYVHCAGAEMATMKSYYRFIFEPISARRTRVRLEARVEAKRWWVGFFARLMTRLMKQSEHDLLQRLKAFCEEQVAAAQ